MGQKLRVAVATFSFRKPIDQSCQKSFGKDLRVLMQCVWNVFLVPTLEICSSKSIMRFTTSLVDKFASRMVEIPDQRWCFCLPLWHTQRFPATEEQPSF